MSSVMHWREVAPVPQFNGELGHALATVDSLRAAWQEVLDSRGPDEFAQARYRSLRRHAIETGIIERLYDVDWGITEALVAEGLTVEVAAREGGISDDTLEVINSQFDALTFLAEAAREGRDLSAHFIRELHHAITRHQDTYVATDVVGRRTNAPLHHGQWKLANNHVRRPDGTLLEYAPYEHVEAQIDLLVKYYAEAVNAHPIVTASWLHHSFICIHPFEDGNGRVARALTLLVLLRSNYAPLVVDRRQREDYIRALDAANDGDLTELIRLFAQLEMVALRSELEPVSPAAGVQSGAVGVARAHADRLRSLGRATDSERAEAVGRLAQAVQGRVQERLEEMAAEFEEVFQNVDTGARVSVVGAVPPQPQAKYWRAQIIEAAKQVDFYTNLSEGSWWTRLQLSVLGQRLRFLAVVQKVGHGNTGVLALTVFAEALVDEIEEVDGESAVRSSATSLLLPGPDESVTFVYSDALDERWPEVDTLLDRALAAAIDRFGKGLGL